MERRRRPPGPPAPFEMRRYAPDPSFFSPEEHEMAQRHGYEDAVDRWVEYMECKQYVEWRESVLRRALNATRKGLASVGLSGAMLGRVARAAATLPAQAVGRQYDEEQVAFGETLVDHLRGVVGEMQDLGASPPYADETEVSGRHRERFRELQAQGKQLLQRLYDLDLNSTLRDAAGHPPRRLGDEVLLGDDLPEHPELRRVALEYAEEVAAYEARRGNKAESTRPSFKGSGDSDDSEEVKEIEWRVIRPGWEESESDENSAPDWHDTDEN